MSAEALEPQAQLSPLLTSLTDGLTPRLHGQVDVLLFNPPYVPTEEEELYDAQEKARIAGSWAGGALGMDITDLLLAQVDVRPSSTMNVHSRY